MLSALRRSNRSAKKADLIAKGCIGGLCLSRVRVRKEEKLKWRSARSAARKGGGRRALGEVSEVSPLRRRVWCVGSYRGQASRFYIYTRTG